MASKRDQNQGLWRQVRAWMHQNQRVVWVMVLVLVCFSFGFVGPVQDFFFAPGTNPTRARIYGQKITDADLENLQVHLGVVMNVLMRAAVLSTEFGMVPLPLPGLLDEAFRVASEGANVEFFAFREKARREGFRVSDEELGEYVRFLWERIEALRAAREEEKAARESSAAEPPKDIYSLWQAKQKELRTKRFDAESWAKILDEASRNRQVSVSRVEEMLRDLLMMAKLFRQVEGSVKVTPQEALEEFLEQKQRRKLTWAEFPVTQELEEAVSKTVTDEDVALQYEAENKKYELPDTVKARWLLVPKAHFLTQVASKIAEEDLQAYYQRQRNLFRKPAVSSLEASFYPLSPEERTALDQKLFFSLDEVREKVREKAIEEKATSEMTEFGRELARRLYPTQKAGEPASRPATFADLLKEYPFLESKTTGFVEQSAAQTEFGRGYSWQVGRWFDEIARFRRESARDQARSAPKIEAPRTFQTTENGLVFYSEVQHRGPRIPPLREIAEKVRKDVVLAKCLKLLRSGLEEISGKVDRGETTFEDAVKAPLEVVVEPKAGESEKAKVSIAAIGTESSLEPVERQGVVKVARAQKPADEAERAGEKEKPGEDTHRASQAIAAAGFGPAAVGKTGVGTSEDTRAAYLVRVDEIIPPDTADFAKERSRFEMELLRRRRNARFAEWRKQLRAEVGIAAPAAEERPTGGGAA